jgi:hypothetical protein
MYSRCLSCRAPLGRNECLEQLPVGRSLAFDPVQGRLWVVCRACRSWNLAPLLERWEPLEELERIFQATPVEASSDNVALGRARDGTALVRIGPADRREFAFWRYARRLKKRWTRSHGLLGAVTSGPLLVAANTGVSFSLAMPVFLGLVAGGVVWQDRQHLFRTGDGRIVRRGDASRARLVPDGDDSGWRLEIPRRGESSSLVGGEALRALRAILPRANIHGGKAIDVDQAVARTRGGPTPARVLSGLARQLGEMHNMDPQHNRFVFTAPGPARPHRIATARPVLRLAVEIAANEETERRALEGEMSLLEQEWREAEELAAISDELLIPPRIDEWIRERKRKTVW